MSKKYPSEGPTNLSTVNEEAVATGRSGFLRIDDEDAENLTGRFAAIKAMNGDVTLAAGITTETGDSLEAADVVLNGDIIFGPFTTITPPTTGTLLVYLYPHDDNG